jgi:nitrogen-specific signal transduction histidine kinase
VLPFVAAEPKAARQEYAFARRVLNMKLLQRITGWMRDREHDDARLREILKWLNHELRTPLTALSAAAQVLETAEPGSADATEARAIVVRQTQQLTRIVNELSALYPKRNPSVPTESQE